MSTIKKVSILGCGWFGLPLGKALVELGFDVSGSVTSEEKFSILKNAGINPYQIKAETYLEYDRTFFDTDLVVISIPPKRSAGQASVYSNKLLLVKEALISEGVKRVIFISSTGVYADDNREVDENTAANAETESGKAIALAEKILREQDAFKINILRFGGLFGPGREPGRFFAGKRDIPNGLAPVNMIHLDDCIGVCREIIRRDVFGFTFNACAMEHPPKMEFYTRAASVAGFELPQFIEELVNWKIVKSSNIERLLDYRIHLPEDFLQPKA